MVDLRSFSVSLLVFGIVGCAPDLDGGASVVNRAELIAVSSQPAEAKPGEAVEYRALYVSPAAAADSSGLAWGFCTVQKPLALIGPVAPECLEQDSPDLLPIGSGAEVMGSSVEIPKEACSTFGPTPAQPKPGMPPSRPTDPDPTGGYYQPVVVRVPTDAAPEYVVGVTRLDCGLSGASQEQSIEYTKRYRRNENPLLDQLVVRRATSDEESVVFDQPPTVVVAPGERVTLSARWASCPLTSACGDGFCTAGEDTGNCAQDCENGSGCSGSELYPVLDTEAHELVDHRETIRLSWFTTSGRFEHDTTGRPEAEAAQNFSDNRWTAPSVEGTAWLWLVLRDDRGGTSFRSFQLDVHR